MVAIIVPLDATGPEISVYLNGIIEACRGLLDYATKKAGCSINLAKSEVVLCPELCDLVAEAKDEFVWLGYSLKLHNDGRLEFSDKRMKERFKYAVSLAKSIFQYVRSIFIRWRIFKVYISPIIDWFIPVIALKPRHELAAANEVEQFQHNMLCLVTGASTFVSARKLADVMKFLCWTEWKTIDPKFDNVKKCFDIIELFGHQFDVIKRSLMFSVTWSKIYISALE